MKSADQQPTTATTATATTTTQQKAFFWSVNPGEPDREPARESENFGVFIGGQGTRQRTRQRIREVWIVYRRPGNPTENAAGKDEWNG